MSRFVRLFAVGVAWLISACLVARSAWAVGMENFGPVGQHLGGSADWPKGVEDLLRHQSRVYGNDVNGYEHVYFDGDLKTINDLLDLFAKVRLPQHDVIIRPGQELARSFQGKLTAYVVELDLPGGFYLNLDRGRFATGLYSRLPRLIIQVNQPLAEHLDQLQVPANVSLLTSEYRIDDALAEVDSEDRSVRGRAIQVLGEAGVMTPPVLEALTRAETSDDEYIRESAKTALTKIEQANETAAFELAERVANFVSRHPQRDRTPAPDELLAILRKLDEQYADGFTARGQMIDPATIDQGRLIDWTVTMGDGRLVLEQRVVEDEDHSPTNGRSEWTLYAGPEQMATIQRSKYWLNGELIHTNPFASFEPVGSTYDLLIGRMLWPLGRGFSRRLGRVTEMRRQPDGTLAVVAETKDEQIHLRWEMQIDPRAEYLVRHAEGFRPNDTEPAYVIDNIGLMSADGRATAHTARYLEGPGSTPVSISVTSVSADADLELIRRTKEFLDRQ